MATNLPPADRNRIMFNRPTERRDLLLGFGLAAAVAVIGIAAVFLSRRAARQPDEAIPVAQATQPTQNQIVE